MEGDVFCVTVRRKIYHTGTNVIAMAVVNSKIKKNDKYAAYTLSIQYF